MTRSLASTGATVARSFQDFLTYLTAYLHHSTEITTHKCSHKRLCEVVPPTMRLKRFTVHHLRRFRDHLIREGLSRKTIREYLNKTIRWLGFAWENGLISQATCLACKALWMPNPRQGRPPLRTKPVRWADIQTLLPFLPPRLRPLIQLHWLTAARPCEIVQLNAHELEEVQPGLLLWHLRQHKNSWRGEDRTLFLGPPAIQILNQLTPDHLGFYFPSHHNPAGFLSRLTYQRLVKKCTVQLTRNGILNTPPEWTIRGIRSGRAREIQQSHGLEAARIMLGHSCQSMTSRYVGASLPTDALLNLLCSN